MHPCPTIDEPRNAPDLSAFRSARVDGQVAGRGIRSHLVLNALRAVAREEFVPAQIREFAYEDAELPLADGRTIPRPCIVGAMVEAMGLKGGEKVLEVCTGSGYVTAVLARIARSVHTVEPVERLALTAASALKSEHIGNVHVLHGEASWGWPEHAPFDAILVNLPGPHVPDELKQQLKVGGRLVMPVGVDPEVFELVRVVRTGEQTFRVEDIEDLRAGPVLGEEGQTSPHAGPIWAGRGKFNADSDAALATALRACAEKFATSGSADLEPLLRRIGDARIVLLGESTHGTSEFYRMRERISRELIERKNFSFIAIEGDWPDAARIDYHVRGLQHPAPQWTAFARFPTWMWRNQEMRSFVDWLHAHNAQAAGQVSFHGLDLYSMHRSARSWPTWTRWTRPRRRSRDIGMGASRRGSPIPQRTAMPRSRIVLKRASRR